MEVRSADTIDCEKLGEWCSQEEDNLAAAEDSVCIGREGAGITLPNVAKS